jgi:ribosomal protein RSM22 (predicted rRNA methylase)
MLGPCPAETPCPLIEPDWCHFAARVERSSLHRRLKGADLGYEDEKFSYLALSRQPATLPQARIIRRPQHLPGLIQLETCTPQGIRPVQVRKKDREQFRSARKLKWGDIF